MASVPVLLVLFLIGQSYCAIDNSGSEFVLSFMANRWYSGTDFDIEIYITTMSNNVAQVNVTTPLYNSSWISQVNATRGNIVHVNIPTGIRGTGVAIENKTVHITATEEVTVYCVNKQKYSTDAFTAYPVDSLGSDYIAITWENVPEIMVASITDGTVVTFNISSDYTGSFDYSGVTYTAGSSLSVTLNRFKTFHIYSSTGDFTGTTITATNLIAAFSGNQKTTVSDTNTLTSSDHLVEQLVPTQSWGKEFITYPSPERVVGDYCRVLAAQANTNYTLDGTSYTLNANEYQTHNLPSGSYYWISSDKGISVAVFSKTIGESSTNDGPNGGDPAMSIAVPVALYGSEYTWSTVTTTFGDFNNYIIVVSYDSWTSELIIDGANVSTSWTAVVGNSQYVATVLNVTPGAHSIYNNAPAHSFLGMAYGNAEYNSYAYPSGLHLASINLPCNTSSTVAADGVDNDCDGRIDEETDNGVDDDGDGQVDEDLAAYPRVNGNWGDWAAWSSCSSTCGNGSGTYSRIRNCDNPAPANNGQSCDGSDTETGTCTGPSSSCPIDGDWGSWGNWSTCSVTCASGEQTRTRACDSPTAQYGGNNCTGNDTEYLSCTISDYCLPSVYGNLLLGCGNSSFGCATGIIQCIDIAFRCDGSRDCDDGTDENEFFAGCAASVCRSAAGRLMANPLLAAGAFVFLYIQQRK